MAEDREFSDRKHEKSKKRDRKGTKRDVSKISHLQWNEEEKLQLAEAIDMYGITDVKKIAGRIPTKTYNQVLFYMRTLKHCTRKELESKIMTDLSFVDLSSMDDLFVVGGTRPKEVLVKWMEYLDNFYNHDFNQYDKFKLFSKAFLIMSECLDVPEPVSEGDLNFKKIYYFLYRVFNQYYINKRHKESYTTKYLHDLMLRVLQDIEYTSSEEKFAMYQMVTNWTSVNRKNALKVYGSANVTVNKPEPVEDGNKDVKPELIKPNIKVFQNPMIPSFNPLRLKSNSQIQQFGNFNHSK